MAQEVKALLPLKPDDLSLIPRLRRQRDVTPTNFPLSSTQTP